MENTHLKAATNSLKLESLIKEAKQVIANAVGTCSKFPLSENFIYKETAYNDVHLAGNGHFIYLGYEDHFGGYSLRIDEDIRLVMLVADVILSAL